MSTYAAPGLVIGLAATCEELAKLKIAHGGGTANLDCLLRAEDMISASKSKHGDPPAASPVTWRAPYLSHEMGTMLEGGWKACSARPSTAG